MKKWVLFSIILVLLGSSFAQKTKKDPNDTWSTLGFDFYLGGGFYLSDNTNANYYNGAPTNEVNLGLLFNNTYRFNEIAILVRDNYPYVDSLWLGDYPTNMKYSMGMNIGLGVKYKFRKNWGISINYSHVKLTATDVFLIKFDQPPGNQRNDYAIENLIALEERSFFDISIAHLFHPSPILKPFVEIGFQFNYVKVKSFEAIIEEQHFDLLSAASSIYVPGQQTNPNYRNWAAPGFGTSITGGVKIVFNETFSIDPLFTLSLSSLGHSDNLPGYKTDLTFNYIFMVRLVASDLFYSQMK